MIRFLKKKFIRVTASKEYDDSCYSITYMCTNLICIFMYKWSHWDTPTSTILPQVRVNLDHTAHQTSGSSKWHKAILKFSSRSDDSEKWLLKLSRVLTWTVYEYNFIECQYMTIFGCYFDIIMVSLKCITFSQLYYIP